MTFGHANLMETRMTKRSKLIDGLWRGALSAAPAWMQEARA